jgi:BlaI family transcriptional regulator, penicillinase repressor
MPRSAAAREIPPPLELLCLRALWSRGEASVRQVQQALAPSKALAYTTVMTLLERLARKGVVSRRKSGRAFLYAAEADRDALRRIALQELLDTYFEGSAANLQEFLRAQRGADEVEEAPVYEPEPRLDTILL